MLKELVSCVLVEVNSADRFSLVHFIEMKMFHRFVHNVRVCGLIHRHSLNVSEILSYANPK